ncbi:MAG TPA: trehalose-phosphatase [Burkholderiaceae bacterium]|jgi:trehalose 6-phosphate phosphatase
MRHLFTKKGEAALAATLQRRPLLAFDFDGTLAPIVARPDEARIPTAVAARLSWLVPRLPVAIVTGRSVADVRGRLGFTPRYIVGNHGAEEESDPVGAAARAGALTPLRDLLGSQGAALAAGGILVEDKGQSIALHYRLSRHREDALTLIRELLSQVPVPLHVFAGKMVVNATAAGAPDKAHAVRALLARSGASCAFFAGDDVNDEPVFASAPPTWLTVRVGRGDPTSRAQFFLDSPHEMVMLIERMLAQLPRLDLA